MGVHSKKGQPFHFGHSKIVIIRRKELTHVYIAHPKASLTDSFPSLAPNPYPKPLGWVKSHTTVAKSIPRAHAPRIFSGFPYTPSSNGHLLAIKSLQQKKFTWGHSYHFNRGLVYATCRGLASTITYLQRGWKCPKQRKPNLLPTRLSPHKEEYAICMLEGV